MAHVNELGEVISASISPTGYNDASVSLKDCSGVYSGEVIKIHTHDSSEDQIMGKRFFTLYDVKIFRPNGDTELIYNCVALQPVFGGGINNYMEVVTTTPPQPAMGTGGGSTKTSAERSGHKVLVGFIGGYKGAPVILGGLPHPSPVTKENRPTKDEGAVTRLEIQGTMVEINNDGEFTLKFQGGPKNDMGKPANSGAGETIVNIDKDGILSLITKEDEQSVVMDAKAGTIKITNKKTVMTMDGSTVSIVGDAVETGTGSLEPHVCGDTWKSIMEELIDEISQIIVPTGVGPSGTPQNAAKFSSIKQKLKSALSAKHTVEK